MHTVMKTSALALAVVFALAACEQETMVAPEASAAADRSPAAQMAGSLADSHHGFNGPAFDIEATPNGNILVAAGTVQEIGRGGIKEVTGIPTAPGSPINGLAVLGQRNFFATSGGLDLAVGAGLWRASQGNARLVADIEDWTMGDWDHDDGGFHGNDLADAGPYPSTWKDFRCEEFAEFSYGPQTNPYHLTALSGSQVLIGDAANNGVLHATTTGDIDWVAFMEPPLDPDTGEWMVLGYTDEDGNIVGFGEAGDGAVECYVEPVPTSVAVGPDGSYYVGELTGTTPGNFFGNASPAGLARVWRIAPGSRNVVCPSDDCEVVFDGLDTVIDIEFGPDGLLYVVEYERSGFLGTVAPDLEIPLKGGTLKRCDLSNRRCRIVEDNLVLPGAVTFDKWDNLWLLENVFEPTVRKVDW